MTGAAGHLNHLTENLELTFGEIKEVLFLAFEGKLEQTSEKVDGINIMFSYNVSDELRFARSHGDIKSYGLSFDSLHERFTNQVVGEVVNEAFVVLDGAFKSLQEHEIIKIFGARYNRWYSAEIVCHRTSNVINYDGNHIIIHTDPVLELNAGLVIRSANDQYAKLLNNIVQRLQNAIKHRKWNVNAPHFIQLQKMTDGTIIDRVMKGINDLMLLHNVDESSTLRNYIRERAYNQAIESIAGCDKKLANLISARIAKVPGAMNLTKLKQIASKDKRDSIDSFVKNEDSLKSEWLKPIETLIYSFSVELLKCLRSTFISDQRHEIESIKERLSNAISKIESSNDGLALSVLQKEIYRLGDIENVSSALEGIVFKYKGQSYKFTGHFAPINRILGLFKYGKMTASIDHEIY